MYGLFSHICQLSCPFSLLLLYTITYIYTAVTPQKNYNHDKATILYHPHRCILRKQESVQLVAVPEDKVTTAKLDLSLISETK